MLAEQDALPAYIMRANRVASAWQGILSNCFSARNEMLELPRLRLGQLAALVDRKFALLSPFVLEHHAASAQLERMHQEWAPKLRMELHPTNSPRKILAALSDLIASFERFNRRWESYVDGLSFETVNYERQQYNDYFLVEKAAALGSDRLAEMGFERLRMCGRDDVLAHFPRLFVPVLAA